VIGLLAAALLTGEIPWQKDWTAASTMAAKNQKLIFLVIDSPKGGC
jgi:hypothetical protein